MGFNLNIPAKSFVVNNFCILWPTLIMCPTEFLSLSGSQIGHCSGRKFDVPPFREQHRCPMVGQALRCLQIGDQGRNFVPILDGCVHSVRKSGADLCPTFTTLARMCTVFGYKKRWWFRNVKYLSGRKPHFRLRERRTTLLALVRSMVDDLVRIFNLVQGRSLMTSLTTRLAIGFFATAFCALLFLFLLLDRFL